MTETKRLRGYDFWRETLQSPKFILAPMVDQSELAWRLLSRQYGAELTFTPMMNATLFSTDETYRKKLLQVSDDDKPLIVQFCGNDPQTILTAAKLVQNQCDAIDLNLGCPQNIAKRGRYGAYLEDWSVISSIVKLLAKELTIPVMCKFRVFDDVEKTCEFAKMLESSGASVLSVHGRTREQKGPMSGLADWSKIKAIKDCVSVPVIANGNILCRDDVDRCMKETGADAVMTAEGHLYNPAIFTHKNVKVADVIDEYCGYFHRFPTPMSAVRAHVFKLCFHILQFSEFLFLRGNINELHEIKHVHEFVTLLNDILENCENIHLLHGDMKLDIRYCQARVRGQSDDCVEKRPSVPVEDRKDAFCRLDRKRALTDIQASTGLSKRLAKKLIRNPAKVFVAADLPATLLDPHSKSPPCACGNPSGRRCVNMMCKTCCRTQSLTAGTGCYKHKYTATSNTASTVGELLTTENDLPTMNDSNNITQSALPS